MKTNQDSAVSTSAIDVHQVFAALETWIKQRPGLNPADYGIARGQNTTIDGHFNRQSYQDGLRAYRADVRSIGKDRQRAMRALDEARNLDPKPKLLMEAFSAFSGRLEWKTEPYSGEKADRIMAAQLGLPKLEYTTGQYFPTEYRKAAATVLERYISSWKQADALKRSQTFTYRTMADVVAANRAIGHHFFDLNTMRCFHSRIESRLIAGKLFITSEKGPEEIRKYTVREAQPDGTIDTVGDFQQYYQAWANIMKG